MKYYYNKYSESTIICYSGPESSSNTTPSTIDTCTTLILSPTQSGNLYIYIYIFNFQKKNSINQYHQLTNVIN